MLWCTVYMFHYHSSTFKSRKKFKYDFILALRRLITQRVQPKTIWNHNGTNFVGANKELV